MLKHGTNAGVVISCIWLACCAAGANAMNVQLECDRTAIGMGRTVKVTATVRDDDGGPVANAQVLTYVNGRRWGAHEATDAEGACSLLLPLPNPGAARVQAVARPPEGMHGGSWIWPEDLQDDQKVLVQKTFSIKGKPTRAVMHVAVDDSCEVFFNDHPLGRTGGWQEPAVFSGLEAKCEPGRNVIAVEAHNGTGPAGLLVHLVVETQTQKTTIVSDGSWSVWPGKPDGWPDSGEDSDKPVGVVCGASEGIWAQTLGEWPGRHNRAELFVGAPMPDTAVTSNTLEIDVIHRPIRRRAVNPERLVGAQWEPWFTPRNAYWQTAQAVPVVGFYDSYNPDVIRQHAIWLAEAGIDFVLADWSNHIWGKQHWDERAESVNEIIRATTLTLEHYAKLRDEGIPVPKMVLMPGLSNGPPTTMEAMNEQLDWIHQNYLCNPEFDGLWLEYEGKPLIVILDCGVVAQGEETPVDDSHFTVRWMSTQLQRTGHEKLGYWSWMDGSIEPVVTFCQDKPEVVTVSTAFFGDGGWLYPQAYGRRGGATYIDTMKPAIKHRPRFVMLHQFNEFAGQPEGHGYGEKHDIYVDSYSVELSDDIEPVSLTAHAYRGQGGWGFFYLNLTRALIDAYHGDAPEDTLLAVAKPLRNETVRDNRLEVEWSTLGKPPESIEIKLDGRAIAQGIQGNAHEVDLESLEDGPHLLTVVAAGARTRYPLSYEQVDEPLADPLPCSVETPFVLKRK